MEIHPTQLAAKVAACNKANAYINTVQPLLVAALAPFLGKKIRKADSVLTEKARAALEAVLPPDDRGYRGIRHWFDCRGGSSLFICVSANESYETRHANQCSTYCEAHTCIGAITGGSDLTSIAPPLASEHLRRTDYTTEEIRLARERVKEAKRALSQAESAIIDFGEYDN
jgi:hypothetical protein